MVKLIRRQADGAEARMPVIEETSRVRRDWTPEQTIAYIRNLPIWTRAPAVEQKFGGMQNRTFFVTTGEGLRFVARVGFDQYRTRQTSVVQCTLAAARLGLGPELIYAEPNLTITTFLEGRGVEEAEMKDPKVVSEIVASFKVLHGGAHAVAETISYWWPFDTVRRYFDVMEAGKAATGFVPSKWAGEIPRLRDIVDRLERAIGPFTPTLTHNDAAFVNMFWGVDGKIKFIDWDGGGYGHPLWDIAEMLMWGEADDALCRLALNRYYGELEPAQLERRMHEVRAFQIMAALRLSAEVMETYLDPYFFLTPDEMSRSMAIALPGQRAELEGLVDLLMPRFESLWSQYQHAF